MLFGSSNKKKKKQKKKEKKKKKKKKKKRCKGGHPLAKLSGSAHAIYALG